MFPSLAGSYVFMGGAFLLLLGWVFVVIVVYSDRVKEWRDHSFR